MSKLTLSAWLIASLVLTMPIKALAKSTIGEQLAQTLPTMTGKEKILAVITFQQMQPLSVTQIQALVALGINKGVKFSALPVIGVVANAAQIKAVAARDDVRSIWLNRKLSYFIANSRQNSGVNKIQGTDFVNINGDTDYSGKGVTIMVNDSGIDATHPDLFFGDVVIDNVEAAIESSALAKMSTTETFISRGQYNTDVNTDHGTHCAGIIAGSGAMSDGKYKGVAPDAKLVGYGSGADLTILDAVSGYDYAINHRYDYQSPLRIISNAWGSTGNFDANSPIGLASYKAYTLGILSIFSAGNSGAGKSSHNPYAQLPWVISVGAGNSHGHLVDFSSRDLSYKTGSFTMPDKQEWTYNNQVTVVAPGHYMVSTRSSNNGLAYSTDDDFLFDSAYTPFYSRLSGTSIATSYTAGVAAIMMEANPLLSIKEIKQLIAKSATQMLGYQVWEVGAGYIDIRAAVAAAKTHVKAYK
jgi:serine protease AprX